LKRILIVALLTIAPGTFAQQKAAPRKLNPGIYARFETSMGNFMCELYQFQAPNTVANFVDVAEAKKIKGKRFYDNTTFHRIIDKFMIQGGDPTGTGLGGPGYKINDEISRTLKHDREGRLSMANSGPNSAGSQFFVTLGPVSQLDGRYTIFGQVIDGMDVVRSIGKVPVEIPKGGREKSHPIKPVLLKKVTIERVK